MGSSIVEADSAAVIGSGWWTAVGAGTFLGCLDDSSDATYCEFDYPGGSGDPYLYVTFFNPTIPTNAVITVIGVFARDRAQSSGDIKRNWYWGAVGLPYQQYISTVTNTAFAQHVLPLPSDSVGAPWTPDTANGFRMAIAGGGNDVSSIDYYLGELFISVGYNEVPAPVITGPTSPLTTTSKPTLTWTVNDPDGDAQNRYRVVVRDNATQVILYDSGIFFGNVQSFQVPTPLVNGIYDIRLSLGDAINPNMSPFTAPYLLTITAPLPGTPTLAVTAEQTNNRVGVSIQGTAGSVYSSYYSLERSDDGGVTWKVVQDLIASDWGVRLDGVDDYLTLGDFNDFTGTTSFTLEMRFARVVAGTTDTLINKSNATDGYVFQLTSGAALAFARAAGGVVNSMSAGAITTGVKTNTAATYDGTNLREYIEGAIVGAPTVSAVSMSNNAVAFTIGGPVGGAPADIVVFEVRVWNTARSAANLLTNKDADLIGTETNLVDLWEFDEGEGTTVASEVSGGHTATFVGGPTWTHLALPAESFFDYTAPLGVSLLYRAQAIHDDGTVFTSSAYSSQVAATLTDSGLTWLKSITSPALNLDLPVLGPGLSSTIGEDLVVYEALGRTYPIIFGGTVRSEYFGRLRFATMTSDEAVQFEAIRATKSVVLVQTCFGDEGREQRFVRLGRTLFKNRQPRLSGGPQIIVWEIEAWEVEAPTSQGQ